MNNSKGQWMDSGFCMMPQMIFASRKFTASEKMIIMKVFDMMWMNKENHKWKGQAFPSNDYLCKAVQVSERTIMKTKRKVKQLGIFKLTKRQNSSDVWTLLPPSQEILDDYEEYLEDIRVSKIDEQAIIDGMDEYDTDDELDQYFEDSGVKWKVNRENAAPSQQEMLPTTARIAAQGSKNPLPKHTNINILNNYTISKNEKFATDKLEGFISQYRIGYRNAVGSDYQLSPKDNKILSSIELSELEIAALIKLIPVYFTVREKFITDSDYSIFYFLTANVQNFLNSRYHESDEGRWTGQAEKILKDLDIPRMRDEEIEGFIRRNVRFGGASKDRDAFVLQYLKDHIAEKLKSLALSPIKNLFLESYSRAHWANHGIEYQESGEDLKRLAANDDKKIKDIIDLDVECDVMNDWFKTDGGSASQLLNAKLFIEKYRTIAGFKNVRGLRALPG